MNEGAGTVGGAPARPVVSSLWLGDRLGPLSAACLASFIRHGHRVVLYCYGPLPDAPPGVELADAAAIVPAARIFRHKQSGSFAPFADLFRYELLRRGGSTWIDCDLYCLRRFDFADDHVYGWEDDTSICNAVLRLPAQSSVLQTLARLLDETCPVPPWLPAKTQQELTAAKSAGAVFNISHLPWVTTGPMALTHLLRAHGLVDRARPASTFYPLHYKEARNLLVAGFDLGSTITPGTYAIHLWNQVIGKTVQAAERGSPIDRLLSRGSLVEETEPAASGAASAAERQ